MQAQLIPIAGGKPIDIVNDITLVGRKRGLCDLIIDRGSVSKLHCLIVKTDGLLFIRDLGSTNGTKVNGQRVTRGALLPNDELAFAGAKYRVHLGPGEPATGHHEHTEMIESSDDSFREYESGDRAGDLPSGNYDDSADPDDDDDPRFYDQPDSESDVRLLSDDSLD
jgi:predicted component of type VI protein secretion system